MLHYKLFLKTFHRTNTVLFFPLKSYSQQCVIIHHSIEIYSKKTNEVDFIERLGIKKLSNAKHFYVGLELQCFFWCIAIAFTHHKEYPPFIRSFERVEYYIKDF